MKTPRSCPRCGTVLPASAPEGLCPRCLLLAGADNLEPASVGPAAAETAQDHGYASQRIDRYKILQRLGEGGCGEVYMAEQTEPVRRRVALKVIKLGMDTRQVIARFEAERQALAMMDHPNIAKVLDAGTTGAGRPYFVMELVKGIRITDYCDQNNLFTGERLGLFVQVCHAIQHAHQKGVIHRDIKPSNILVTLHDGVPVPKVIDFGIAKATEQPLTEKTVFTAFGQFMGTPAYMSPEQAEMSGLDIDTRSDIYALGVLLYELLTASTPFDAKELFQAGVDEMRRRIREDEPLRPSTRLSTLANADLTLVARHRKSDPGHLTRFIRGDLDWIVMKCLEKDRTRRYETANGLAMDIQRHLNNEPVVARPPSAAYRFQKLVRRNKLAVAATAAVAVALLLGLGLSTWLWLSERQALRLANEKTIEAREARERADQSAKEASDALAASNETIKFFVDGQVNRILLPREHQEVWWGQTNKIPHLVPPGDARLNGKTYEQLAANWWKWALELPRTTNGLDHPVMASTNIDVTMGQSSEVWFLASPFGKLVRHCKMPAGKALFVPLFVVECSNLESGAFYGATPEQQAGLSRHWANHIQDLFCVVDDVAMVNLDAYRVVNPPFNFTAPSPWILGEKGGPGISSGEGYFVYLSSLPPGPHTLRFGGAMVLKKSDAPTPDDLRWEIDVTYHLTVAEATP